MTGKAMFLIRVQPGKEVEFQEHWKQAAEDLKSQKGFRARELIRVEDGAGTFVVLSEWDSPNDYHAWRNSLTRAHVYSDELSPLFSAPPVTGVGEVIQRME
jgi:heme-degrading monooxygenase HmoA